MSQTISYIYNQKTKVLTTLCLYLKDGIMIGSYICENCQYFVKKNKVLREVICNYKGK